MNEFEEFAEQKSLKWLFSKVSACALEDTKRTEGGVLSQKMCGLLGVEIKGEPPKLTVQDGISEARFSPEKVGEAFLEKMVLWDEVREEQL